MIPYLALFWVAFLAALSIYLKCFQPKGGRMSDTQGQEISAPETTVQGFSGPLWHIIREAQRIREVEAKREKLLALSEAASSEEQKTAIAAQLAIAHRLRENLFRALVRSILGDK
jgi:hypothetical protein